MNSLRSDGKRDNSEENRLKFYFNSLYTVYCNPLLSRVRLNFCTTESFGITNTFVVKIGNIYDASNLTFFPAQLFC